MSYLTMRTCIRVAVVCVGLCVGAFGQDAVSSVPSGGTSAQSVVVQQVTNKDVEKKQISRMRGKLLYKKGQIRKLEHAVVEADATVAAKAADLERQRRELYMAKEAKLARLYEEQDALDAQIKAARAQLKK